MRALRLVVLAALGLVLADDGGKDMEPCLWDGGETVYPTGEKHFNGLATRAQIHNEIAILALPKLKQDTRSSCAKLIMTKQVGGPTKHTLVPFPEHEPEDPQSPERLQSVVDVFLDHMGTLWALDVGAIYPPKHESDSQPHICPPKVVGYDVTNGKVRHVIDLMQFVEPVTRLQFLIVDFSQDGKPFLYASDAGTKSLIVWDVTLKKGRRVNLPGGILNDFAHRDVLYMFIMRKADGHNKLFITYRSGESLWCINTEDLQRDMSLNKAFEVGKKKSKMIILGTDDWDHCYFRLEQKPHEVYKWNADTEFDSLNFQLVHKDVTDLIPTHAITDYKTGVMRLCSSNLPKYLDPNCPAKNAENALIVMSLSENHQPTSSHEL